MQLGGHDIYCSVAGGLRITEPAADLGIALAIASAFRDVPIARNVAAFGELGLSGEVRTVSAHHPPRYPKLPNSASPAS